MNAASRVIVPRTVEDSRRLLAAAVSENELQGWILEFAGKQRWRRTHSLAVRRLTDWFRCNTCRARLRFPEREKNITPCPRCPGAMEREVHANTPIMGDPGMLDLTLVRPPRLIYAELKTETGRVRPDQQRWLDDLRAVADAIAAVRSTVVPRYGVEVYLWRPRHWLSGEIRDVLAA